MKKFFWGDIHNHNGIGYGSGGLERSYEIAKGCLLDFYAFTPHGYWPDAPEEDAALKAYHREGYKKVRDAWPELDAAAEKYNASGKFAVLRGFEWHSSKSGDYCVYLPGKEGSTFPAESLEALRKFAKKHNALLIPHHIGYRRGFRGLDWSDFDEKSSPVVDAFSEHGCSIQPHTSWPMKGHSMGGLERSQTVFSRLNEGMFFGITASTDNHHGHPASAGEGLTGLYMDELTTESIFNALRKRRSLAVTGERIEAFLKLGSALAGDIAEPKGEEPFECFASGFGDIEFIRIIRNGKAVHTQVPAGDTDKREFAGRIEFGWGGMMAEDITCHNVEMRVEKGEFTGLSPGFCGGADSEKMNRITESTSSLIRFEAFTSRKNTYPVSYVAFRCAGESAIISIKCKMLYRGETFQANLIASADELSEKDVWMSPAGGFSSPVLKLGGYSPLNMFKADCLWKDADMKSGDWYMLEVRQKNGHLAWTSPIKIA